MYLSSVKKIVVNLRLFTPRQTVAADHEYLADVVLAFPLSDAIHLVGFDVNEQFQFLALHVLMTLCQFIIVLISNSFEEMKKFTKETLKQARQIENLHKI